MTLALSSNLGHVLRVRCANGPFSRRCALCRNHTLNSLLSLGGSLFKNVFSLFFYFASETPCALWRLWAGRPNNVSLRAFQLQKLAVSNPVALGSCSPLRMFGGSTCNNSFCFLVLVTFFNQQLDKCI